MEAPGEKLIIKLWETLAEKGVGSLLTPWRTIREGRARNEVRRQELLMLAQARVDTDAILAGRMRLDSDGSLLRLGDDAQSDAPAIEGIRRVEPKLNYAEMARDAATMSAAGEVRAEINSAKAIIFAEEQLAASQQEPPTAAVEEDWLFAWKENASRVSTEDLQKLWGSILAGELQSPGRYSLRTLDFLKGLSKVEAEMLTLVASFVIEGRVVRSEEEYLDSKGANLSLFLKLQEIGVLNGVESIGLETTYKSSDPEKYVRYLRSHNKILIIEHEDPAKELKISVYLLSEPGIQILTLGSFDSDVDYLTRVGRAIVQQGFKVRLGDYVKISEEAGRYFNAQVIELESVPPAVGDQVPVL